MLDAGKKKSFKRVILCMIFMNFLYHLGALGIEKRFRHFFSFVNENLLCISRLTREQKTQPHRHIILGKNLPQLRRKGWDRYWMLWIGDVLVKIRRLSRIKIHIDFDGIAYFTLRKGFANKQHKWQSLLTPSEIPSYLSFACYQLIFFFR